MSSGTRFGIPRVWAFRILSQNAFTSIQTEVRAKMMQHKLENTQNSPKSTAHFFGAIFRPGSFFTQLISIFYTVSLADTAAPAATPILPLPPLSEFLICQISTKNTEILVYPKYSGLGVMMVSRKLFDRLF